jgi:hypothetical protein
VWEEAKSFLMLRTVSITSLHAARISTWYRSGSGEPEIASVWTSSRRGEREERPDVVL